MSNSVLHFYLTGSRMPGNLVMHLLGPHSRTSLLGMLHMTPDLMDVHKMITIPRRDALALIALPSAVGIARVREGQAV